MNWYGPDPIGRDQARELVRRELEKPSYHQDEPSVLDRVLQKIDDWLTSLSTHLPNSQGTSTGWTTFVILLVALIVVIALIWRRVGNVRRVASEPAALLDDRPRTADDHRTDADRFAAAGDWPQAIRERLRAIARDLEERAIVAPRAGRTADELASEAGKALPDHADELKEGVRVFDDVWYGGRDGDADGYRRLTELDLRLLSARPAPVAAGVSP